MAIEKYIAAASLGLFIMFVGEIITIFYYMQTAPGEFIIFVLEPDPKILQFISIGAAPAIIMAGVSFLLTRRYGSRLIGSLIIAGGAVMFGGMVVAHSMAGGIHPEYEGNFVPIITPLFMAVSVPIMVIGAMLLRRKQRRRKKEYV
ncbi:hypothetical protein CENSYa_0433 [Cenarchaeum symbiosum A]|uniref:Uncharacterized protein n=1 Tax=Cenarchaeum symbiosum (strain A) TaxID=414004 RepID=A0RUQ1_CENSY|nr:hypothetical protein CENSYa_0433 [Cenarchaeum symbiosum A]